MNFSLRRSQRGVSLLELMLALAVIAILLIMATRYFTSANLSQQVNNAVDQFVGVRGATNGYLNDNQGGSPSINVLVTGGYLPQTYAGSSAGKDGTSANPWGGDLSVAIGASDKRQFTVKMTGVPATACPMLLTKLQQSINPALGEKVGDGTPASGDGEVKASPCATSGVVDVTYNR